MSQTTAPSTATTTTTTTTDPLPYTIVLQRQPEIVERNIHLRDGTLQVNWTQDTVDNEHLNKRKSKKCCIFRKPKDFDQSSDESSWEDPDPEPHDGGNGDDNNNNNNGE